MVMVEMFLPGYHRVFILGVGGGGRGGGGLEVVVVNCGDEQGAYSSGIIATEELNGFCKKDMAATTNYR